MLQEVIKYFNEAYNLNPLGQIVGFVGFFLSILAFLNKDDKKTKVIHSMASFTWAIHFFMIGLYVAVAVNIIGIIRNILSIKYKGSTKVLLLLIFLYLFFGFLIYKDIFSLFPVISGILVAFAFFKLEGIKLRLTILFCSMLWLTYDIIGSSIGGTITELFIETSLIITIYRLYCDKNKKI